MAPVVEPVKETIPPELTCSICKELVRDAVIIPCCAESFCDECESFVNGLSPTYSETESCSLLQVSENIYWKMTSHAIHAKKLMSRLSLWFQINH